MKVTSWQKRQVLHEVFLRENKRCFWCGRVTRLQRITPGKKHSRDTATFDHIILASDGGPYTADNGVLACFECNGRRGSLPADGFLRLVMGVYDD